MSCFNELRRAREAVLEDILAALYVLKIDGSREIRCVDCFFGKIIDGIGGRMMVISTEYFPRASLRDSIAMAPAA